MLIIFLTAIMVVLNIKIIYDISDNNNTLIRLKPDRWSALWREPDKEWGNYQDICYLELLSSFWFPLVLILIIAVLSSWVDVIRISKNQSSFQYTRLNVSKIPLMTYSRIQKTECESNLVSSLLFVLFLAGTFFYSFFLSFFFFSCFCSGGFQRNIC